MLVVLITLIKNTSTHSNTNTNKNNNTTKNSIPPPIIDSITSGSYEASKKQIV